MSIENNKLIAEFMGGEFWAFKEVTTNVLKKRVTSLDFNNIEGYFVDLKYNSSWDWLMPVLDKIDSLGYWSESFSGNEHGLRIGKTGDIDHTISQKFNQNRLQAYYNTIISFIEWYNKTINP